jgi:hypothetical protein
MASSRSLRASYARRRQHAICTSLRVHDRRNAVRVQQYLEIGRSPDACIQADGAVAASVRKCRSSRATFTRASRTASR